jgi:hypothetical protein
LDEANLNQTEKNDYMNYFDQMNKAYVKTALGKFTDPSFNSAYLNNMTNYVKSDSEPVDETKIDPAKYYKIHSAVVSKYGNKDLKETLSIFRAEVRKKNPTDDLTSQFNDIDKKYPIDNKDTDNILAEPIIAAETGASNSVSTTPLNKFQIHKDILAIAAVHRHINKI